MGHGYVRSNYGCNCFFNDSSYKRYNRAHLGGDTLIFNYNYGIQGGSCGGGCGMGFWGGVGLGLGGFLGNMFGNMFGGGFGNFWGGGSPFACFWGGGGSSSASRAKDNDGDGDASIRRSRRSSSTPDDIDNPKIADFTGRINGLKPEDKDGIQKLKDEIKAAKEATDDLNKESDLKTYNNLILQLEALENGITNFDPNTYEFAVDNNGNISVKIGETPIKINKVNGNYDLGALDNLAKTNPSALKNLDKDTARMLLLKLGYINDDAYSPQYRELQKNDPSTYRLVGKFSNNYAICLLLEASKVNVEVAQGTSSKTNERDNWITGPIKNVALNNGKLSYNISCATSGHEKCRYDYILEQATDTTFTIDRIDDKGNKTETTKGVHHTYTSNGDCRYLVW